MLNEKIESNMTDSEKYEYEVVRENYWQATDEVQFGTDDCAWLVENCISIDTLIQHKKNAEHRMFEFEESMRRKYT